MVPIFLRKSRSGTIDVAKFGKVVKSGWGANPGPEAVEYIEELCKKRRLDLNRPADQTPLHLALFKGKWDYILKHAMQHLLSAVFRLFFF